MLTALARYPAASLRRIHRSHRCNDWERGRTTLRDGPLRARQWVFTIQRARSTRRTLPMNWRRGSTNSSAMPRARSANPARSAPASPRLTSRRSTSAGSRMGSARRLQGPGDELDCRRRCEQQQARLDRNDLLHRARGRMDHRRAQPYSGHGAAPLPRRRQDEAVAHSR